MVLQYRQKGIFLCVNALSGLYLISTLDREIDLSSITPCVNALSGLYLISTMKKRLLDFIYLCVNALSGLYLISTSILLWWRNRIRICSVNALSGLYLISTHCRRSQSFV